MNRCLEWIAVKIIHLITHFINCLNYIFIKIVEWLKRD
jgi:hypothetical protein